MYEKIKNILISKHPDKKNNIDEAFLKVKNSDCKECKKNKIIHNLLLELNEIPPPNILITNVAPRPPCEECFKEHVAKAIINLNESLIGEGYPKHRWLAIANLAEASAEILGLNKELAAEIRELKKQMIRDKAYVPDLMIYL